MIKHWLDLPFWNSGELQVILERLDELDEAGISYCPIHNKERKRDKIFRVFDEVPFDKVRVVLLGQDPYPKKALATGVAFEVPGCTPVYPASLSNLFRELVEDIHCRYPPYGGLDKWTKQGVLLLNTYYTCLEGLPGSHMWPEYEELTKQVLGALPETVVCVLMGGKAHEFSGWVRGKVIKVSHPSPLGVTKDNPAKGVLAFKGCRLFSTVNAALADMKQDKIDWSL
jgi:uracil-DNA glycosylase